MRTHTPTAQLGFEGLLDEAETVNYRRAFERSTGHLPGTLSEALPHFRALLATHHAAMLAADVDETMRLRKEADNLARRLNHGEPGILAGPDAPGCILRRETAAARDCVPLWGQQGSFVVTVSGARVRIAMDGIFGIGSSFGYWPGFAAHVVDAGRPFISETGYRSFLGIHADPAPGMTPEAFAAEIVAAYVAKELKGRLVAIEPRYRERSGEAVR
ncbi:MAG: hypothetical protein IPK66_17815 [Rhodospirillales bacterium]|nr:hypothetical protein [Rhodospirillales bacterium]